MAGKIVVVLKGYPRLSETFIAQELLGLERAGLDIVIISLRRPDRRRSAIRSMTRSARRSTTCRNILHDEPCAALSRPGGGSGGARYLARRSRVFRRDLRRDLTRNRFRRFGQALVLADRLAPRYNWLHAHFIHTPASVAHYAGLLTGLAWTCSAHAKDIWTSPDGSCAQSSSRLAGR